MESGGWGGEHRHHERDLECLSPAGAVRSGVGALRDFPQLLSSPLQLFLACWAGKCVSVTVTKPCHLPLVQLPVRRGCQ